MAKNVEKTVTDTSEYYFNPDKDLRTFSKVIMKAKNSTGVSGTIALEGTTANDENFDNAVKDTYDVNITDGETKVIYTEVNWRYVRGKFVADDSAANGNVKMTFEFGKHRT